MYPPDPFELVPAGLGPVLKERGFENLTSVQSAVLTYGLHGGDLRVSSQTGSGKTVAIGLAVAHDLVENAVSSTDEAGSVRPPRRPQGTCEPQVLLIAPTRELAAQLRQELGWLYRPLRKSITVVTGGTNIGLDFRSLKENPEVLVGTPGRLFDHVKRGTVDLSKVRAVVLDEADEMLDMGFRDELEGILKNTPAERRTHMVSATFPREVLALANRYQKDAVTVQGDNPKSANEDITHLAYDIRMGDRVDGLINLLLAEPQERTLVFVRTRVATTEVATDLTAVGFKAFPLNGEMGQRERTSTLDAFRSGKVRLLIATDVAARGLDIRDVGRIVHFDLPENPEAFTHRSGRTGRAGAKGTSVLFVPPSGRRKVDYLTRSAKVKFEWQTIPSVRAIKDLAQARFLSSFTEEPSAAVDEGLLKLAERILEGKEAHDVVAQLLARIKITGTCEPRHIRAAQPSRHESSRGGKDFARSNKRGEGEQEDYTRFQVTWGAAQGADPRRMLALICRRGGVRSNSIGAIRISDHSSVIEVKSRDAGAFEKSASRPDTRDPRIKIRPWLEAKERGGGPPKSKPKFTPSAGKAYAGAPVKSGYKAKNRFKAKATGKGASAHWRSA